MTPKQEAALRLAREALKLNCSSQTESPATKALAAIDEVLAEQPEHVAAVNTSSERVDKTAENVHEQPAQQEPVANRDDVIRWAREAGMEQDGDNFFSPSHEEIDVHIDDLERFAAAAFAAGAAAEREELARFFEDHWRAEWADFQTAAAIRARGQA